MKEYGFYLALMALILEAFKMIAFSVMLTITALNEGMIGVVALLVSTISCNSITSYKKIRKNRKRMQRAQNIQRFNLGACNMCNEYGEQGESTPINIEWIVTLYNNWSWYKCSLACLRHTLLKYCKSFLVKLNLLSDFLMYRWKWFCLNLKEIRHLDWQWI